MPPVKSPSPRNRVLHIPFGAGRSYRKGGIGGTFLADGDETSDSNDDGSGAR
jgi:hypothetical protein